MNSSNQFFNLFLFYIEYGGVRGIGMCTRAQVPAEGGLGSNGAAVTGCCEPPDDSVGNRTQDLCKGSPPS